MKLLVERMEAGGLVPPWAWYDHIERYRWAARHARGKRVLDAACGTGYGTAVLAAAGAAAVTGLDVSDDALRAARADTPRGNVNFQSGDVCALSFPDGTFDLYVSFETVEHLADPARYAHEARRVLAPDGVFLCSTPNRPVSNPGTGIGDQPYNPFHVREYDAAEFAVLLREAFPEVEVFGQSLHPAGYVRGLGRLAGWSRRLAVRSHQLYKAARSPIDRSKYHRPEPYTAASEPETLFAVCRGRHPA